MTETLYSMMAPLLVEARQQQPLPARRLSCRVPLYGCGTVVAAPQTFCLVTGIITAWLIFIFLFDKNYLVFKKKRAFEHPSCNDTGHSLGVTWTVVENRPGLEVHVSQRQKVQMPHQTT